MDIIYPETWEALVRLREAGVSIWFADKLPKYRVGEKAVFAYYDFREESVLDAFTADGRYFAAIPAEQIVQKIENRKRNLCAGRRIQQSFDCEIPKGWQKNLFCGK